MYIISNNNAGDDKFINSIWDSLLFTYNIALGSWDVSGLGKSDTLIIMTLFILSTLFLCIIMLNLIIAVISDTYARVEGTSQNELYKNFSDLIMENEYLVPAKQIAEHDNAGSYLYIAKLDENDGDQDELEGQLSELKNTITQRVSVLDRVAQKLARTLNVTLQQSAERFNQLYVEDSIKQEIAFKYNLKKLESGAHNRQGSTDFGSP